MLLLGVIGGLLGAYFTYLNEGLADLRKRGMLCAALHVYGCCDDLVNLLGIACNRLLDNTRSAYPLACPSVQPPAVFCFLLTHLPTCLSWLSMLQYCCHMDARGAFGRRLLLLCSPAQFLSWCL